MKQFFSLFSLIILASCSKTNDYVLLYGKIDNADGGKIMVRGESFEKEINLNPDGTFSDTLLIKYNGSYSIGNKNNFGEIYLTKGNDLKITTSNDEFYNTITFTGKGAAENTYIKEKSKLTQELAGKTPEFYSLNEKAFLTKVEKIKKAQLALLEKTTFDATGFKKNELKNIDYAAILSYLNYPTYHQHFAQNPDFKPSADFPEFDEKTNLDNDTDFLFSNAYKQIVSSKFYEKTEVNKKSDNEQFADLALPYIKKLKSQNIKNALVKNLSYEISPSNENSEKLYNELIAHSTDDKFKENLTSKYNKIKNLVKGKSSPLFDYENYNGGKTSLNSLKDKYVYIDVWATWCGPCKHEIPFLKEIETLYKGKNIHFVSISIDREKDHEKWRTMVSDMKLGGIQLFADKDWKSQFVTDYAIDGIPRFILLDPQGNIISADAPRPSDKALLIQLFNNLKI